MSARLLAALLAGAVALAASKGTPPAQAQAVLRSPEKAPAAEAPAPFPELGPLPPAPQPADNPATPERVALGRMLFFESRLAGAGTMSCAICHEPLMGWGDGTDISRGYPGSVHFRNSQTLLNAAYHTRLGWDGAKKSLEEQAAGAILSAIAQNGDAALLEERLAQMPEYVEQFRRAFGAERPQFRDAVKAIAAFERAVPVSRGAPFDAYARGDADALSARARRGLALFRGRAGCARCHHGALFSDEGFHATGVPENPFLREDLLAQITLRFVHAEHGLPPPAGGARDRGLYFVTKRAADDGKFRTPSLRELRYTAPYMHNGVFATLEEVLDFYDAGAGPGAAREGLAPLGLSKEEKAELLAFLDALSGEEVAISPELMPTYAASDPAAGEHNHVP